MSSGLKPPTTSILALVVMGATAVAVLVWPHDRPDPHDGDRPPTTSTPSETAEVPPQFYDRRRTLDARIEAELAAAERGGSWVEWDHVAQLYLDRADTGGGLEDLGNASDALDRAFAAADPGVGPHLRRATLDFRLHRLDECEAMIEAVERYAIRIDDGEAVSSLRADLAFFRGDYATARERYEARASGQHDPVAMFSLARLEWSTGHAARAAELLAAADAANTEGVAIEGFLALAHATFERDRGHLEEATRFATRAVALRSGNVDTLLLLAELRLEQEELEAADALVARALAIDDEPPIHELAARIARARGDEIAVEEHRSAATRAIESSFARFPEAIAGHALLHFLRFEDETRAVEMAEVNAQARPFGEARARLALAYLRAGRTADARREIEGVLATEWSTGESHAIAAEIFEATDDPRASVASATADVLAPGARARVADLRRR